MPQQLRDVLLRVGRITLERAQHLLARDKEMGADSNEWKTVRDVLYAALSRGLDDISVELAEPLTHEEMYGADRADAEDRSEP